uniref:Phytanoyl-CoA dioxygenase n=1 Tax=Chromera velia CCMP2878 TaxID=1169474 RepID=A0A0G4FG15_9ALVE|eukprot:Cvel_16796.t1-p1 / transcript=Cvel_16796.t1 / gene=Cvel_16796 / organism=Chromera_velia_CCMP2878 / gene_product=hypothetical protein / transcript_product=hypothetical protein / location=Cvel_scaffold1311:27965-29993(+) / protein_length=324 / sequence_SO=supercontig / SO=protein_coding / is_pseudo=false
METFPSRMENKFPGFEEEVSAPRRHSPETWEGRSWPGGAETGIINSWGAGQSPFQWFVRTRPQVRDVFSALWETDDLLCSFDGFGAFRPWRLNPKWKTQGGWWHVDQNPISKPDRVCVQGLVSLYDGTSSVGGLTVIPGSHKEFCAFGKRAQKEGRLMGKTDFVPVPHEDPIMSPGGRLVLCKAGDLLLWDSRTVHCNTPGESLSDTEGKKVDDSVSPDVQSSSDSESHKEPVDLIRIVSYVCMTPAAWADTKTKRRRMEYANSGVTTNHWPHEILEGLKDTPPFWDAEGFVDKTLIIGKDPAGLNETVDSSVSKIWTTKCVVM